MDAFVEEALPEAPPEDSSRWLERRAADPDSDTVIWEDGKPVSMGGYGGLTPNGIRVGPIYTPPELRRRGYGTALTAAITRMLLEGGRRFCFLFTDLANPTSNSIYQRIGYRPVTDVDQLAAQSGYLHLGAAEQAQDRRAGGIDGLTTGDVDQSTAQHGQAYRHTQPALYRGGGAQRSEQRLHAGGQLPVQVGRTHPRGRIEQRGVHEEDPAVARLR